MLANNPYAQTTRPASPLLSLQVDNKPDPEGRLYHLAVRNLREYHGVPSMSPTELTKTLAFLKLYHRRLVKQGLAPKAPLSGTNAGEANNNTSIVASQSLGGAKENRDNKEDFEEAVAADTELMNAEGDQKEWNDGCVSVKPAATRATNTAPLAAKDNDDAAVTAMKKHLVHEAFISGGIQLRPGEVRPLLLALGVRPRRLVKLGYVDGKHLPAMLQAENRINSQQQLRRRMSRVGGPCGGPRGLIMGCGARHGVLATTTVPVLLRVLWATYVPRAPQAAAMARRGTEKATVRSASAVPSVRNLTCR